MESKSWEVSQRFWSICNTLNGAGKWYLNEDEQNVIFHFQNQKFLELDINNAQMNLFWVEWKKLLVSQLEDFKNRLCVEQDIDLDLSQQTNFSIHSLQIELWLNWCRDFVREVKAAQQLAN